ncbi:putative E3 ubiquitin-protein ligase-like [Capsicum annuum]|nr:putative E3 ubiquitin-protein ligase-like [Capsicum annuum]KAF3682621.1 putative E3 ubiquitin-protein ligase-like [Capsicum annuum]
MAAGAAGSRELDQTPTWAVALVCAVIVLISIFLEKVLHAVGEAFERRRKSALVEALEKIKGELMVLGFISLLLTFGQNYIAKICIPERVANTMLPCPPKNTHAYGGGHHAPGRGHHLPKEGSGDHRRRLLSDHFRILAADSPAGTCKTIRGWKEWEREVEQDYEASNVLFLQLSIEPKVLGTETRVLKRWRDVPLGFCKDMTLRPNSIPKAS